MPRFGSASELGSTGTRPRQPWQYVSVEVVVVLIVVVVFLRLVPQAELWPQRRPTPNLVITTPYLVIKCTRIQKFCISNSIYILYEREKELVCMCARKSV